MRKNYVCQKRFGTLTSVPHFHFRAVEQGKSFSWFLFVSIFSGCSLLPYHFIAHTKKWNHKRFQYLVYCACKALCCAARHRASGFKQKVAFVAVWQISCHQFSFEIFHNLCNAPCNEDREMRALCYTLSQVNCTHTTKIYMVSISTRQANKVKEVIKFSNGIAIEDGMNVMKRMKWLQHLSGVYLGVYGVRSISSPSNFCIVYIVRCIINYNVAISLHGFYSIFLRSDTQIRD